MYGNGLISELRGDIHLYHHYNHLGSTMKLTDEEGNTVSTYAYGTYGELLSGNAGLTRFLYNGSCGVGTDANGLYYMRQRYYNPETKRFLNQDILTGSIGDSQSLNRYSYVQGNPVNNTDPFGLSPLNMTEGTGLTHGILGLLGCVPGPVGAVASLVDAGVYCFVDHDYGMAALSFVSSVTMGAGSIAKGAKAAGGAAKTAAGAAKAAKIARTAEYVHTAGTLISNTATFAKSGINLWQDGNKLYQKYKAGEKISTAEAITVGLEAVACAASGAGMVGEAKTLGRMMKEDNVAGRLKEAVGRFGSGSKQYLRSEGDSNPVPEASKLIGVGEGEQFGVYASRATPVKGYTDVIVHGAPPNQIGVMHNGEWVYLDHRSLANYLRQDQGYSGGPIRLLSCGTGSTQNGFAQNLANKMGVEVMAPSDTIWAFPNGKLTIGPNSFSNIGQWNIFRPGNN